MNKPKKSKPSPSPKRRKWKSKPKTAPKPKPKGATPAAPRKPPTKPPREPKPLGRPLKFKTAAQLQKKVDEYFDACAEHKIPPTITGLALALDTTRQTFIDYEGRDAFTDTIKKAKLRCENYAEIQLFRGRNVAGVIFNMKNNYGWKDKRQHEHDGTMMIDLLDELEGDDTEPDDFDDDGEDDDRF